MKHDQTEEISSVVIIVQRSRELSHPLFLNLNGDDVCDNTHSSYIYST